MSATFIATTRRGDYNAMRYQGILVTDSYAQLASMLEKRLTPEHALFFAEPVHDASGETIDWYTTAEGAPVPLASLPEDEQNAARERIKALASDIDALAVSLKEDENASRNIRGNILALALRYPGTDHIYVAGSQPVLTCWGFMPGTIGAQPEDLMRLGAALPVAATAAPAGAPISAPGPATATAAVAVSRFPWWRALLSFLLGLLLLAALFFLAGLLFGPGGCAAPGTLPAGCSSTTPPGCAPAVVPDEKRDEKKETPEPGPEAVPDPGKVSLLTAEQEKEATLRRQLDDLRKQLEARAALCVRTPPEPPKEDPKPEEPEPEEPKEEIQPPSLAELMPTTPDPPKEEPKPDPPKPDPKPVEPKQEKKPEPKQKKGEDMRIPESAKKNKDVSFLEGCWDSDPGLVSMNTGEPIDVKYCFDANGRGTRSITMTRSKDRCAGSVRAQFDALGNLIINADGAPCGRGSSFVPQDVQCTQATGGGKATCYGQERGGKRNKWDAKFRRS